MSIHIWLQGHLSALVSVNVKLELKPCQYIYDCRSIYWALVSVQEKQYDAISSIVALCACDGALCTSAVHNRAVTCLETQFQNMASQYHDYMYMCMMQLESTVCVMFTCCFLILCLQFYAHEVKRSASTKWDQLPQNQFPWNQLPQNQFPWDQPLRNTLSHKINLPVDQPPSRSTSIPIKVFIATLEWQSVSRTNNHVKGWHSVNREKISLVWSQSNAVSSIKGGMVKELRKMYFSETKWKSFLHFVHWSFI